MERWFNILKVDFYSYQDSDCNILEYYKYASTCYAITEYIFKQDYNGREKMKQQLLNNLYETNINFIYNKKYYFNALKHMNESENWDILIALDFRQLVSQLYCDTHTLINKFNARYTLSIENEYITSYFKNYQNQFILLHNPDILSSLNSINNYLNQYNNSFKSISNYVDRYNTSFDAINNFVDHYNTSFSALNNFVENYESSFNAINNFAKNYYNFSSNLNDILNSFKNLD